MTRRATTRTQIPAGCYLTQVMDISVIGLGYVGAVTAGCLAKLGHTVVGVDKRPAQDGPRLPKAIRPSRSPGSTRWIGRAVSAGRLRVDTVEQAVAASELIMVAVGTPSTAAGGLDLAAVLRVAEEIGRALPNDGRFRTVAIRSTVLPGTTRGVRSSPSLERRVWTA